MKKLAKITALILTVVTALSFAACSTYGKVQKAFADAGYAEATEFDVATNAIKAELEKDPDNKFAVELHLFNKGLSIALVCEFSATDDMINFYKNSNTAQGFMKDLKEAGAGDDAKAFYNALVENGYANGNCLVLSIGTKPQEVKDIVKKA